jgi:hypothetical protein
MRTLGKVKKSQYQLRPSKRNNLSRGDSKIEGGLGNDSGNTVGAGNPGRRSFLDLAQQKAEWNMRTGKQRTTKGALKAGTALGKVTR